MRKLTPARVSYRDDFLISYRVYIMTGSFHISLFKGTLRVDKIHVWFKIASITHALPVPVYRQTDFTPKRVDVSRLHDTVARFRTGVKFSPGTRNGVNSRRGDSHRHDICVSMLIDFIDLYLAFCIFSFRVRRWRLFIWLSDLLLTWSISLSFGIGPLIQTQINLWAEKVTFFWLLSPTLLFNNYSSSPNGLWVNSPWGRRPNRLLTQRPWGREE